MPAAKLSLTEKIAALTSTSDRQPCSTAEAVAVLETLQRDYPDWEKFLSRRFSRLPESLQHTILNLLQAIQLPTYAPLFHAWSHNVDLAVSVRARVLSVLAGMGEGVDAAYHENLERAAAMRTELVAASASALTGPGDLQSAWCDTVLDLPLALALDLGRDLIPESPVLALAVLRVLLSVVDAKDCQVLVQRLALIPLQDSVTTLQDLLATTTDKPLQKTIKKALHRLRAQGLVVADQRESAHTVVGGVRHRLEQCLASHIDAAGDRALWMIRTRPFGGYNIAHLVINYGTGIRVATGLQASKRDLSKILVQAQERIRLIELEPLYCQHQVALAHQMNLETRTPVPEDFFALREIIGEPTTTFDRAIIYAVLSEADLQDAQSHADRGPDLLQVPEFAGWRLPTSIIGKYADQLQDIEASQLVVSQVLKQERIAKVYALATQEVLGDASRRIMRLRLEEMAYFLWQTERRHEALWAVAAAQSMQQDETALPRRNRFVEALLERSLDYAKQRPEGRIVQPFSHLPTPGGSNLII
ncbi:hypothetical protein NKDENANG_01602 [Candidatus Entotheonellaceae bacterium PAL068K]